MATPPGPCPFAALGAPPVAAFGARTAVLPPLSRSAGAEGAAASSGLAFAPGAAAV